MRTKAANARLTARVPSVRVCSLSCSLALLPARSNVAVSAVTLGYFDTWCERAAALVGL
jgi:hypothetical protein